MIGEAADGHECLALVDKLDPDVVLMDIRMPGVDGIQATRRRRRNGTPRAGMRTYDLRH